MTTKNGKPGQKEETVLSVTPEELSQLHDVDTRDAFVFLEDGEVIPKEYTDEDI